MAPSGQQDLANQDANLLENRMATSFRHLREALLTDPLSPANVIALRPVSYIIIYARPI